MAAITVTKFQPIFDNAQIPPRMMSAPVSADMTAGTPVVYNTTTGEFDKANNTATDKVWAGLLTKDTKSGYVGVAFTGLAYIDGIDALNVGSVLTLNATAGQLDDTQVTATAVARVVPVHKSGGTFTKAIEVFDRLLSV